MEGWWVVLTEGAVVLVLALLGLGFRSIAKWVAKKIEFGEAEKEAYQLILEGMAKAQEDLVRYAKAAAADGKLTKEEIKEAQRIAYDHALAVAKGPAKDILIAWGKDRVVSIIKQLLAKLKGGKDEVAANPASVDTAGTI